MPKDYPYFMDPKTNHALVSDEHGNPKGFDFSRLYTPAQEALPTKDAQLVQSISRILHGQAREYFELDGAPAFTRFLQDHTKGLLTRTVQGTLRHHKEYGKMWNVELDGSYIGIYTVKYQVNGEPDYFREYVGRLPGFTINGNPLETVKLRYEHPENKYDLGIEDTPIIFRRTDMYASVIPFP